MIGVVVAAHGTLAEALVATARLVVPGGGPVEAVSIAPGEDGAHFESRLRDAVERARRDGGVLVLTDMFGGTPSNVGLTMHESDRVEVLTGANLPMLIKALNLAAKDISLADAARQIKTYGERAIAVASEVLSGESVGDAHTEATR